MKKKENIVVLHRSEENPILQPNPGHPWESKAVFNPGVCQIGGDAHLFYRAMSDDDTSVIGYALTRDGVHIHDRLPDPVYVPREAFEKKLKSGTGSGCEDPRLTRIGDTMYMCYTAYDGVHPPRIALTSILIDDMLAKRWNWSKPRLISPPGVDDKDAAIFPEKINGKYAVLHRIGISIWIDFVDDLTFKPKQLLGGRILMNPRTGSSHSQKIGICGPPMKTADGWLLLYHGISRRKDRHYDVRAALLDLNDPTRVLARTSYPIFEPETPYERNGLVANVVFPCGSAVINGTLYVYYGGADKVVGVACVELEQLSELLRSESIRQPYIDIPKQKSRRETKQPNHEVRPWGEYTVLDRGDGFQVKRITIHPGQEISYQFHHHRSEHWTIVSGKARIDINDHLEEKKSEDMISIPSGVKHRIKNIGDADLIFIEVQNGTNIDEGDVERLSDDYGRIGH
ncbi:MAG: cupin domain-containing protein [Patescibacteria group bacterium]